MVFLRSDGGGFGGHYVPLTSVGTVEGMGTVLVGTEELHGYADAGTEVDASVTLNTNAGGGRIEVTLALPTWSTCKSLRGRRAPDARARLPAAQFGQLLTG